MKIKPQSAKAKGRKLQQIVRDAILQTFPELHPDDVRSTSMGAGGEDVQLSFGARLAFPYTVECKNRASFAVYKDFDQATAHNPAWEPLLVIKQNGRAPLAVVNFDHFMAMRALLKEKTTDLLKFVINDDEMVAVRRVLDRAKGIEGEDK